MKHWLFACLSFVLLCAAVYAEGWEHPTDLQSAVRSGDLVRIHILAHDDTQAQQEIKLHVRDAILAAFTPLLQGASSGVEAAQIVQDNLDLAQRTAENAAAEMGFAQAVRTEFGVFPLPGAGVSAARSFRRETTRPCAFCWATPRGATGGA